MPNPIDKQETQPLVALPFLASKRELMRRDLGELNKKIRRTVREAQETGESMTDVAKALGISRPALYGFMEKSNTTDGSKQ